MNDIRIFFLKCTFEVIYYFDVGVTRCWTTRVTEGDTNRKRLRTTGIVGYYKVHELSLGLNYDQVRGLRPFVVLASNQWAQNTS